MKAWPTRERLVFYCRTTSTSTAPCTSRRTCRPKYCDIYCQGLANPWCRLLVLLASTPETGEMRIKRVARVLRREGGLCERKVVTTQESS